MLTEDDVTRIVKETVTEELSPSSVRVNVKRDIDVDGDIVINITVVIEDNPQPDRKKMLGLPRHIMSRLQDGSDGFPVLSFISMSDAENLDLVFA